MRTFVQVETDVEAASVKITAEEAEVSNLEPYSLVHVKARLCKVDEDTEIEYCGDHAHFELRSNVAGENHSRLPSIYYRVSSHQIDVIGLACHGRRE